ncbi:DnaD domain protein, partial [Staphylococcus aureus]|uniref:DnaD domain-containing protein n=1 Tax=Staphylococcus aureus TaxID=1280 RepID=UPI00190A9439
RDLHSLRRRQRQMCIRDRDNDGLSPTVQSEQYNLYSKEVNSTKRTDNIIDNQHNTHEDNTHEDNTHYNTSDSSSQDEIINKIKTEFGIKITPAYKNEILKLIQHFNNDIINYAIEYASTYGSSPKQFLLKVLNNWKDANIKTLEQAQNYTVRSNKNNIVNFSREKTPKWLHEREDENTNEEMTEEEKAKFEKEREAFRKELEENWGES